MEKRTKIEWSYTNAARTAATVREVFVDSGRTKRIIVKLDADDTESLEWQITGAVETAKQSVKELTDALYVLTLTPATREFLEANDKMALRQAEMALGEVPKERKRAEIDADIKTVFNRNGVQPERGEEGFWYAVGQVAGKSKSDAVELIGLAAEWDISDGAPLIDPPPFVKGDVVLITSTMKRGTETRIARLFADAVLNTDRRGRSGYALSVEPPRETRGYLPTGSGSSFLPDVPSEYGVQKVEVVGKEPDLKPFDRGFMVGNPGYDLH